MVLYNPPGIVDKLLFGRLDEDFIRSNRESILAEPSTQCASELDEGEILSRTTPIDGCTHRYAQQGNNAKKNQPGYWEALQQRGFRSLKEHVKQRN